MIGRAAGQLVAAGAEQLTLFEDLRSPGGAPSAIHHLAHFRRGGMEVEVIQPRDPHPDPLYLDPAPGPAPTLTLHHLGFLTNGRSEWEQVVEEAARAGTTVAKAVAMSDACFAYLDTRVELGHHIEVVHREPGTGPGGVPTAPWPGGVRRARVSGRLRSRRVGHDHLRGSRPSDATR